NHHSQKPRLHDGSVSNYGQKAVSNVTLRFLNLCLDKGDTIDCKVFKINLGQLLKLLMRR
ncbi:MAG: hypothetical protein AAGU12_13530, partial [Clostridiales bacterium]